MSGVRTVEELLPLVVEPLAPAAGIRRSVHFCLGDIARKPSIEVQNLRALLPLLQALDGHVDRVHVECSYSGQWDDRALLAEVPQSIEVIAGIADVKSRPASVTALREKIQALREVIPDDRLLVSSSCGCGRVPHDEGDPPDAQPRQGGASVLDDARIVWATQRREIDTARLVPIVRGDAR